LTANMRQRTSSCGRGYVMKMVNEDELFDHPRKLRNHCHDVIAVRGIIFTDLEVF
ncbi:Hypothetical protein FKW44_009636, partial [Caligus rogercresseyi]